MTKITTITVTDGKRTKYLAAYAAHDVKTIERAKRLIKELVGNKYKELK